MKTRCFELVISVDQRLSSFSLCPICWRTSSPPTRSRARAR